MSPSINLVVIRSADLDRAEAFYSLIGLSFIRHRHGKGPEHLACEGEHSVFEIYPQNSKFPNTHGSRIGFRVSDVDNCVSKIKLEGEQVFQDPSDSEWGRRAVVIDPDGHKVELVTI